MELNWLEDFICVVEKGHFSRAASERFKTQSALSRHIQALESWVGTELLDRSQHPIQLTAAGQEFIKYARDIVSRSYEGRAVTSEFSKMESSGIKIACLHTLALNYIPTLIHDLQRAIGQFTTFVVPETRTIEEYLNGLYNGNSDFFICYGHEAIPMDVDLEAFPCIVIDKHWVRPYIASTHETIDLFNPPDTIPYLQYSDYTYMARVVDQTLKSAPFTKRLQTVYRASLAESILTATQKGMGLSWLPETVVHTAPQSSGLVTLPNEWSTKLSIRVYRSARNTNPIVNMVWSELQK